MSRPPGREPPPKPWRDDLGLRLAARRIAALLSAVAVAMVGCGGLLWYVLHSGTSCQ